MVIRYTVQIRFQCPTTYSEAPLDDVEGIEVVLEGRVAELLIELFGGPIAIDDVKLLYTLPPRQYDLAG